MTSLSRILAAAFATLASHTALASDDGATVVDASYGFYIGGLPIAEISLTGSISALGYDAESVVQTRGILSILVGGEARATATGYRHTQGHLAPDSYRTEYQTSSEARMVAMRYTGEVADVSISPPEDPKPYDTDAALHEGALDPVTAAVTMMTPKDPADLCNRTIPVFDGKRRYDIVLLPLTDRPEGEAPPLPTWDAPMTRCFGVYERLAGFEAKLLGEQRFFPFDIWFEDNGTRVNRVVRLAGKTKLGYAIGTLKE